MTEEIQPASNKVLTLHNSDLDTITQYLLGKLPRTELSPALEEYIDRMYCCSDLIRTYGSRLKVTPLLMEKYNISRPTAMQLFERTQYIFGSTAKSSQAFYVDILFEDIKKGMNKALNAGDFRAYAQLTKQFADAIKEFTGSADALLYENFEMQQIVIGFFPEKFKVDLPENLEEHLEKLKKAKSKKEYGEKVGEYIDYEDA